LIHAEADDVAVTTSVSQGVSALVSALDLSGERNRIVISEYEFPTVGQIAHAQELRGAEVVHVSPGSDGVIPLEGFAEAIDERTALVCCTAVSFRSGHRNDVAGIARIGHEHGAIVLADSYQAVGAIELDVRTLGPDVVTGGTVKYLLGSAGLGFMWVRDSLRSSLLPTQTGWFADEDIFAMSIADYSPHATARRFDSGTPPVPSLYPGVAGMGVIAEAGIPQIEAHVRGLADRLLSGLDELGATVATARGEHEYGPMICVVSTDPNALVDALAGERIVTSTRDRNLRISLHLYNVDEDVDRILEALRKHAHLLA
jgi:selenocysteine lyase/cysteine desulfurase